MPPGDDEKIFAVEGAAPRGAAPSNLYRGAAGVEMTTILTQGGTAI